MRVLPADHRFGVGAVFCVEVFIGGQIGVAAFFFALLAAAVAHATATHTPAAHGTTGTGRPCGAGADRDRTAGWLGIDGNGGRPERSRWDTTSAAASTAAPGTGAAPIQTGRIQAGLFEFRHRGFGVAQPTRHTSGW